MPTKIEKQLKHSYHHKLPQIDKYLFRRAHRVNKHLMAKTFYKKHERQEQTKHSTSPVWKVAFDEHRFSVFEVVSNYVDGN